MRPLPLPPCPHSPFRSPSCTINTSWNSYSPKPFDLESLLERSIFTTPESSLFLRAVNVLVILQVVFLKIPLTLDPNLYKPLSPIT